MKIKLAILEKDVNYLKRIANFFGNEYNDKVQVYSFTDMKLALAGVEENKIDVFLVSEEFEVDTQKLPGRCGFAYLSENNNLREIRDEVAVGKYQKVELIYKSILGVYAEKGKMDFGDMGDSDFLPIYAFVSAGGGCGSSVVSAATAVRVALKGKKPLYINMEQMGNSCLFFEGDGNGNFSEIIYALKSKKGNLKLKLESNIKNDNRGVGFFDKCNNSLDLLELTLEDVQTLISELRKLSQYDCIILDMDMSTDEIAMSLFERAKNIIIVGDGSEISNDKFARIYTTLEILEQQKDTRIVAKMKVLYNKFRNRTSRMLTNENINSIGGIQMFDGYSVQQLITEISKLDCLDSIIE